MENVSTSTKTGFDTKAAAECIENLMNNDRPTVYCHFYVPKDEFDEYLKKEFQENKTFWDSNLHEVDGVPGAYCHCGVYYESERMECYVGYIDFDGFFPAKWSIDTNLMFAQLVHENKIHPIVVMVEEDGTLLSSGGVIARDYDYYYERVLTEEKIKDMSVEELCIRRSRIKKIALPTEHQVKMCKLIEKQLSFIENIAPMIIGD